MTQYHELKSRSRISITLWLLGATITSFVLSINISPDLFYDNALFSLQMTIAIPLFLTSVFARARQAYSNSPYKWDRYAFFTFILGYGFFINFMGLILGNFVGLTVGIIFFGVNILSDLSYTYITLYKNKKWFEMYKSLSFILILLIGGILPLIGVY